MTPPPGRDTGDREAPLARSRNRPVAAQPLPQASGPPELHLMSWHGDVLAEADLAAADCATLRTRPGVTWVNVDGVHDAALVQRVCEAFRVHPLAIEDVCNVTTRPKLDDYDDHIYVAIKEVTWDGARSQLIVEAVSIVFGPSWVLTFQERPGDVFDGLRGRLRAGRGRTRREGTDWLVHALLDAVVDAAFTTVDRIDALIDAEEEAAVDDRVDTSPARVHALRAELIALRRAISPLREATRVLTGEELDLVHVETRPYFRDLHDHVLKLLDGIDAARERLAWIVELHLGMTTKRTNDTIQVLTVLSSIFLPLTFVVGVYGMNFAYMPELQWRWGYPSVIGGMLLLTAGLVGWYRSRHWL